MTKIINRLTVLIIGFYLLILCGCEIEPKTNINTLNKVCELYKNVYTENVGVDEKEYLITKKIDDQLPYFMNENYKHLMTVDAKDRYAMFKKLAEVIDKDADWKCPVMEGYFQTIVDDYNNRK